MNIEKRDYGRMGIRRADYATPLYLQKLALSSPTSGGRSVSIVLLRTKATELLYYTGQWTESLYLINIPVKYA
jgi:hypothetical protein